MDAEKPAGRSDGVMATNDVVGATPHHTIPHYTTHITDSRPFS